MHVRCEELVTALMSSGSLSRRDVRSLATTNVMSATAVYLESGGLCCYGDHPVLRMLNRYRPALGSPRIRCLLARFWLLQWSQRFSQVMPACERCRHLALCVASMFGTGLPRGPVGYGVQLTEQGEWVGTVVKHTRGAGHDESVDIVRETVRLTPSIRWSTDAEDRLVARFPLLVDLQPILNATGAVVAGSAVLWAATAPPVTWVPNDCDIFVLNAAGAERVAQELHRAERKQWLTRRDEQWIAGNAGGRSVEQFFTETRRGAVITFTVEPCLRDQWEAAITYRGQAITYPDATITYPG